jgi:excinuclease UvrABC ATPase subunit
MKEGEYTCYKCKGTGNFSMKCESPYFYECLVKCPICNGTGKLDWISNIIEPKNNGKLEVDIKVKPVKPVEMIKLDFIINTLKYKPEQKKE